MDPSQMDPSVDLNKVGVMPPPPGVTPDFHGQTYLQHTIMIVYSITFAVATLLLAARIYTSAILVRKFSYDTPLIILAWAVSLAFFIAMIMAMPSGFGKHLWDVTPIQLQGYLNLLLVLAITYIWPPTLTKLAILVLYHRINPNKGFRAAIYFTAFSLVAFTVVFTVLFSGPCNPLATGSGVCLNNIAVAQAVLNIVTDGVIIVLPIPTIMHLKMPLKQRITLAAILVLGSAVVIASCVRVAYVKAMQDNPDVTWTQASAAVWSCVELNIGIVCNCLAQLKPFVRKYLPSLAKLVAGGDSSKDSGYGKKGSTAGGGGSFAAWKTDKSAHRYELHSVDRAKNPDEEEARGPSDGVLVVDEYHVQFDNKSNASSMDNILDADGKRVR